NTFAPSHSRIFKEMIVVANPSKLFETTLGYAPKRRLVISIYQEEIEATYLATAESAQDEISPPTAWNLEDTLIVVRGVVSGVLKTEGGGLDRFNWLIRNAPACVASARHTSFTYLCTQSSWCTGFCQTTAKKHVKRPWFGYITALGQNRLCGTGFRTQGRPWDPSDVYKDVCLRPGLSSTTSH
ncbi:hypothetical protein K439DRAFT_1343968, partial [Ramaria rubella]